MPFLDLIKDDVGQGGQPSGDFVPAPSGGGFFGSTVPGVTPRQPIFGNQPGAQAPGATGQGMGLRDIGLQAALSQRRAQKVRQFNASGQANPLATNFVQGLAENKPTYQVDFENMQRNIYGG